MMDIKDYYMLKIISYYIDDDILFDDVGGIFQELDKKSFLSNIDLIKNPLKKLSINVSDDRIIEAINTFFNKLNKRKINEQKRLYFKERKTFKNSLNKREFRSDLNKDFFSVINKKDLEFYINDLKFIKEKELKEDLLPIILNSDNQEIINFVFEKIYKRKENITEKTKIDIVDKLIFKNIDEENVNDTINNINLLKEKVFRDWQECSDYIDKGLNLFLEKREKIDEDDEYFWSIIEADINEEEKKKILHFHKIISKHILNNVLNEMFIDPKESHKTKTRL
jgi:hypothetical protein